MMLRKALCFSLWMGAASIAHASPSYSVQVLGAEANFGDLALNDAGQVAANKWIFDLDVMPAPFSTGVLFENGSTLELTAPGGGNFHAAGVTAHGAVIGNTGALMALSRYVLKTLPGIDRPAMVTAIPTQAGFCHLLDLGANVDCSAEHLYQFAVMGSVTAEALGTVRPRVALLNVGTEDIKGNQQVKLAASLLQQAEGLNYIGFVEGDGLYRGEADVVVCDGFVGNILLKSSEGLAAMIAGRIEALFKSSLAARMVGALALPLLRRLQGELAPAQHNGASFVGLQGIVVKSHGAAGPDDFKSAIRRALREIEEDLPQRLHGRLGEHLL